MNESFEQLLKRLSQDQTLFQSVEEATRQGVILPILAQLGWNTYNVREVVPEFSVGNGRIDYCLKIGEKKLVFMEVKRITEDLERHEKQILEYSFEDGVEIAVLTNGLLWWLYLPLSKGTWQQRKFFTIDIRQQAPDLAAQHFRDFLSREKIFDGTALKNARLLQASRETAQLIEKTIPNAWEQLLQVPDEKLLELLADKVESMCDHRPDPQVLAE
jgi:predicted type IV restriction endonuclease